MTKTPEFIKSFHKTMVREGHGIRTNDKADPGGDTYSGISRVHWPNWSGWELLKNFPGSPLLDTAVEDFYLVNFWQPIQGDALSEHSVEIAEEVFDTCVNMGIVKGVTILQEALSLLNNNARIYPDLLLDGAVGWKTLESLRLYCASRPPSAEVAIARLMRVMNCLQGSHYIDLMRKHPDREKFRGWFDRI